VITELYTSVKKEKNLMCKNPCVKCSAAIFHPHFGVKFSGTIFDIAGSVKAILLDYFIKNSLYVFLRFVTGFAFPCWDETC